MTHPMEEESFQRLFDGAGNIMEAAYQDREAAHAAIESLKEKSAALERMREAVEQACRRIEKKIDAHVEHVGAAIDQSAARTADEAARLLSTKFVAADAAADAAAKRYQVAASRITWKFTAAATAVIIAVLAAVWLVERAEIHKLQATKAELATEVEQLQRNVAELAQKGGRVQWVDCRDERHAKHLCFRTDEKTYPSAFSNPGETYRIPAGY